MKHYPALDVTGGSSDLMVAIADDFQPTAIEERGATNRLFFSSAEARDRAAGALAAARYIVFPISVDDEDWARRSQQGLPAVTIGRIRISSDIKAHVRDPNVQIDLVVVPSMGFGTGHHATTRLCLAALQEVDVRGRIALDVGTGSGILALAAARLGAARALGLDNDPDAVEAARENLLKNPEAVGVDFRVGDLASARLGPAGVVTANLTGNLLIRWAESLVNALAPAGVLIVSGVLIEETAAVRSAFPALRSVMEREEDEWAGLVLQR